jgi:hypothetical protein
MHFITYVWEWPGHKVSIRTFLGKEAAVEKAVAYFPGNADAEAFIRNNEPTETPDQN